MTDTPTIAQRIADIDAAIATLTAQRTKCSRDLERAMAFDQPDAAKLRNERDRIDSKLEIATLKKRGLESELPLEQRDQLAARVDEGERKAIETDQAFRELSIRRDALAAELNALETEVFRARVARDNAGMGLMQRRTALARFTSEHAEAIAAAEHLVAGEPTEVWSGAKAVA